MNENKKDYTVQTKVTPTMAPVTCVLCKGFGSFSYGSKTCNGCHGKGYVLVPAKEVQQ